MTAAAELLTVREWDRAVLLAQRDRRRAVRRLRARHLRHALLLLIESRRAT